MNHFATDLNGLPALVVIIVVLYLFLYVPIKLVVTIIAHIKQKNDRLRLLEQKTVVAEYQPPAELTPAEIGFLYDAKLALPEVYATVIYLEQLGLIELSSEQGKYRIQTVNPDATGLREFETYILWFLDQHSGEVITKRMLRHVRWKADLIIKRQLQAFGYLASTAEQTRRSLIRIGIILGLLFGLTIIAVHPHSSNGFIALLFIFVIGTPLYFIAAVFLYIRVQKISGEPWLGTPKLKEIWSDIEGYRQFIELVELDNLQFDSESTKGTIQNKTLPYAIALGFQTGWQEKL